MEHLEIEFKMLLKENIFKKVLSDSNITIGGAREYAVGMFFFPQNELKRSQAMKMFEIIVEKEGQQIKVGFISFLIISLFSLCR